MKEQLVSFETAKLAKEKGFNWQTIMIWMFGCPPWKDDDYWCPEKNEWYHRTRDYLCDIPYHEPWYYSPTQGHLGAWIREVHQIHVEIYSNASGWGWILTKINGTTIEEIMDDIFFETYEKAYEAGLLRALARI